MAKKAKSHDRLSDLLAIMRGMDSSPFLRKRVGWTLLNELTERIENDLNVTGSMHWGGQNKYDFYGFRNKSGIKGNGAIAMSEWLALTDEIGFPVWLNAADRGSGKLYAYYESFGFQPQDKKSDYIRPVACSTPPTFFPDWRFRQPELFDLKALDALNDQDVDEDEDEDEYA